MSLRNNMLAKWPCLLMAAWFSGKHGYFSQCIEEVRFVFTVYAMTSRDLQHPDSLT